MGGDNTLGFCIFEYSREEGPNKITYKWYTPEF